jgi:hypothetical protein
MNDFATLCQLGTRLLMSSGENFAIFTGGEGIFLWFLGLDNSATKRYYVNKLKGGR